MYGKGKKMKKAFTFIEIMIVVIIIGIIAGFSLSMYSKIIKRAGFKEVARRVDIVRAGARYYGFKYGIDTLPTDDEDEAWDRLQVDNNPSDSGADLIYAIVSSGGDPALQVSYGGSVLYTYNLATETGSTTADPNAKYLPDNLP